jgi:hypothetical protein
MPLVIVGRENSAAIRIYYEDHGSGSAAVLVHGHALNDSYNVDLLGGSRVSDQAWQNSFYVAISASARLVAIAGARTRPSGPTPTRLTTHCSTSSATPDQAGRRQHGPDNPPQSRSENGQAGRPCG